MSLHTLVLSVFVWIGFLIPLKTSSQPLQGSGSVWSEVETALNEGRPKSAIALLEGIIQEGKEGEMSIDQLKAICRKAFLLGERAGGDPAMTLDFLKGYTDQSNEPAQAIIHAVMAHVYWSYYNQNRWRILNRTRMDDTPGKTEEAGDLGTWDLNRIYTTIEFHFNEALKNVAMLKTISLEDWKGFLEMGGVPVSQRPTLFDFLAHEAIEFYLSDEQAGVEPEGFSLPEDGNPVFANRLAFLDWNPGEDRNEPWVKAVRLFQHLIRFHIEKGNQPAILGVDLNRLESMRNVLGEEVHANEFYEALEGLMKESETFETHSLIAASLARVQMETNKLSTAYATALKGIESFPESYGAGLCRNIRSEIERPSFQLTTEQVWGESGAEIRLEHKNIHHLQFQIFPYPPEIQSSRQNLSEEQVREVMNQSPLQEWTEVLPEGPAFEQNSIVKKVTLNLPNARYVLVGQATSNFRKGETYLGFCEFQSSPLAVVISSQSNGLEGWVVDGENGDPIDGATIELRIQKRSRPDVFETVKVSSNKQGRFFHALEKGGLTYNWRVEWMGQTLEGRDYFQGRYTRDTGRDERTFFFTDRAIYRPGQIVQFKALALFADKPNQDYGTLMDHPIRIEFLDSNSQIVDSLDLRTGRVGSATGQFRIPDSTLTGTFHIRVAGRPNGSSSIRVEAYKRPQFEVELPPVEEAISLGDEVRLSGIATYYSGIPVQEAKVKYTVTRRIQLPWWKRHWFIHLESSSQIVSEETLTDSGGQFEVLFTASPDQMNKDHPDTVNIFQVDTTVTDSTGETHHASRSFKVSNAALDIRIDIPDWLDQDTAFKTDLETFNLDGEPIASHGTFQVYKIIDSKGLRPPGFFNDTSNFQSPSTLAPNSTWERETLVTQGDFKTPANGSTQIELKLDQGFYELEIIAKDPDNREVRMVSSFKVFHLQSNQCELEKPFFVILENPSVEVGNLFRALWASGYEYARAHVEVVHNNNVIHSFWTEPDRTQQTIHFRVEETLRGGFHLRVHQVSQNRLHEAKEFVHVPWDNKQLNVRWEHFVEVMEPGKEETWTAIIESPDKSFKPSEMVATFYDASLDSYTPLQWPRLEQIFYRDWDYSRKSFSNGPIYAQSISDWLHHFQEIKPPYPRFPDWISSQFGGVFAGNRSLPPGFRAMSLEAASVGSMDTMALADASLPAQKSSQPSEDLAKEPEFSLRKNMNETAFFRPQLVPDEEGRIRISFKSPDSLTRWRFLGLVHDTELRYGLLESTSTTQLKLMVQPNAPRFLRQGDEILFPVRITNNSESTQTGTTSLQFEDPLSGESLDALFDLTPKSAQSFTLEPGRSVTLKWPLNVPSDRSSVLYRASASSVDFKDGMESVIPILPSRILVSESKPMYVSGQDQKTYPTPELQALMQDSSVDMEGITLRALSDPVWEVILSLPYLMEYPHDCSEQVFNRYYANITGQRLATGIPKLSNLLKTWQAAGKLESRLERNRDLHSIVLEETPWVRESQSETESRHNLAILLDENRMDHEIRENLRKLETSQLHDGSWPWFPGGPSNRYLTLYILAGFGKLQNLEWIPPLPLVERALVYLDKSILEDHEKQRKTSHPEEPHINPLEVHALYTRSFFIKSIPVAQPYKEAWNTLLNRAYSSWLDLPRLSQAQLALAAHRNGNTEKARQILISLKEYAIIDPELGLHWPITQGGWRWDQAPIETHATLMAAFDEIMKDPEVAELGHVWLLNQKRGRHWPTTKSTADACMTLLQDRSAWANPDSKLTLSVVSDNTEMEWVTDSTSGYSIRNLSPDQFNQPIKEIRLQKNAEGISWAGVHWRYWQGADSIRAASSGPVSIEKALFLSKTTSEGTTLFPLEDPVQPGDRLISRLVIRTDRDLDYVHVSDFRGSGLEPVTKLSQWHFKDGIGYYESIRDSITHLFIEHLPKGTFVLEIPLNVVYEGRYTAGHAALECMYAPEFSSHSASLNLKVTH